MSQFTLIALLGLDERNNSILWRKSFRSHLTTFDFSVSQFFFKRNLTF